LVEQLDGSYRFIHDRVQEAAYSLIPEASRAGAHLSIGRLLLARTPPQKREGTIFDIVNQLNRGAALITSQDERDQLAELNLIAGKRAKASTAYSPALKYFNAGASLVAYDFWERRHDLMFCLELERAECEFLTGELEVADERLTALANRTANSVERAAVACLHMGVCKERLQLDRAVAVALDYLRHVGIEWSPHPTEDEARREYEQIWSHLGDRTIKEVADLPLMSDPESLAAMDVLTGMMTPAALTDQNLNCLAMCRAVNLSIERGNCDASCPAYVMLGRIAIQRFRDYKTAFQFAQVGVELSEGRGLKRFDAGTQVFFATFIAPWMKHVRTSVGVQRHTFVAANNVGDLTYAGYAICVLHADLLVAGDPLSAVQREAELGLAFARKARFGAHTDYIASQLALIRTLRGLTPKFGCFDSEQMEELPFEHHLAGNPSLAVQECWYWIRKMQARYFAGDHAAAIEASLKAQHLLWISPAHIEEAEYHFYTALCRAASCDSATTDERAQHLAALARHHQQLEIWAENCPDNFENRAALVGAEIARIESRELDAMRLYEKAIRSSRTSGFVHNEALAYERASVFYRARGFAQFADTYLCNARACYASWGADGKVRQLDRLYPGLKQEQLLLDAASTITAPLEGLDLAAMIRVSQAVSSEIVLEKLFDTVMRRAMEHAGAERGLLIVPHGDDLRIEAESKTSGSDVIVRLGDASAAAAALPESIVRYAMRTHESVLLDDASSVNPFSTDPYFLQNRVRSILCLPLLNQAKLSGILYLENNLAPRVFTSERITVLKVLVSQAAISLENTRLYGDLKDREAKIRRLVDANILGIVTWDVEGAILTSNQAFLRMMQHDHEGTAAGRLRWWDTVPPDWRERTERALAEVIENGTVQPFESEMFRKDGSRVPVLIGAALFQRGGKDGVAFVLDLSEQKRAEAEIRALEGQLYKENLALRDEVERTKRAEDQLRRSRTFLEEGQKLARMGNFSWVVTTNEIKWSEQLYRIFEFEPGVTVTFDLIGSRVHPEDLPLMHDMIEKAQRASRDFEYSYRLLMSDGSIKYIHLIAHATQDDNGLLEYIGAAQDVTQPRMAEEALAKARSELAHIMRVTTLNALTASIAHEINQPLSGILSNASASLRFLAGGAPDLEEAREAVRDIVRDGKRAGEIITRIRGLTKKTPTHRENVDLNEAIWEVLALVGDEAKRNSLIVRTKFADNLSPVAGDRVELQQVVLNLVINAIEAMSGVRGRPRELVITTRNMDGDYVQATVEDSGTGIPSDTVDKIFDSFYTTKPGGMGMGLSISRSILQSHGGRLWAEGKGAPGTMFHFTVPKYHEEGAHGRATGI